MIDGKQASKIADVLKALSESTRVQIVIALAKTERSVTDIATVVNTEMVNISHHPGLLKNAGLVVNEKAGRQVIYKLNPAIATVTDGRVRFSIDTLEISLDVS